jgi:hypothetical protein
LDNVIVLVVVAGEVSGISNQSIFKNLSHGITVESTVQVEVLYKNPFSYPGKRIRTTQPVGTAAKNPG